MYEKDVRIMRHVHNYRKLISVHHARVCPETVVCEHAWIAFTCRDSDNSRNGGGESYGEKRKVICKARKLGRKGFAAEELISN